MFSSNNLEALIICGKTPGRALINKHGLSVGFKGYAYFYNHTKFYILREAVLRIRVRQWRRKSTSRGWSGSLDTLEAKALGGSEFSCCGLRDVTCA